MGIWRPRSGCSTLATRSAACHRRGRAPRQQWFRAGECQRFVLETLRDAAEPLSDGALSQAVAARRGLNDPAVLVSLQKTVLAPAGQHCLQKWIETLETYRDGITTLLKAARKAAAS